MMEDHFYLPWMADFANKTTMGFPLLDIPAGKLASVLHIDTTLIKFALVLYLALPLGLINRSLPHALLRHTFTLTCGLLLCQWLFHTRYTHVLAIATAAYAILATCYLLPPLRAYGHVISSLVAFGHLSYIHVSRTNVTATNVDDSVVHMVLTIKLYSMAYNLYDGTIGAGAIKRALESTESASVRRIMEDRQRRSIGALPSLLEFYAYVFNFATMFVGPGFEITEYLRSQQRDALPAYSRLPTCGKRLLEGVLLMAINVGFTPYFPVSAIHTTALTSMPWWDHLWRSHIALLLVRLQYYAVWKIAEAGAIAAGYGYQEEPAGHGKSPHHSWSGARNVQFIAVEASPSYSGVARNWNMYTQSWLERYVYLRAPRAFGINRWVTFLFSAFWHGFYPGYYMAFVVFPAFQVCSSYIYRVWRPILTARGLILDKHTFSYRIYRVAKAIIFHLSLDFALVSFVLLDWRRVIDVWRSYYYIGLIAPMIIVAFSAVADAACGVHHKRHHHHSHAHHNGEHVAAVEHRKDAVASENSHEAETQNEPAASSGGARRRRKH